MSKALIVTGGSINVAWAKEWLDNQTFDYCIAADSGLEYWNMSWNMFWVEKRMTQKI